MNLMGMTAVELGKAIKDGQVSVVEATQACLDSIGACEKDYNSFVTVDREGALAQAEEVQKKIDAGELNGPLAGVPIAIKDNMCRRVCRQAVHPRFCQILFQHILLRPL